MSSRSWLSLKGFFPLKLGSQIIKQPLGINFAIKNIRIAVCLESLACCCCYVGSVVSDSVRPRRWQPPGSPNPGTLQARTLEWAAISFSNACMHAKSLQPLSRHTASGKTPLHTCEGRRVKRANNILGASPVSQQ